MTDTITHKGWSNHPTYLIWHWIVECQHAREYFEMQVNGIRDDLHKNYSGSLSGDSLEIRVTEILSEEIREEVTNQDVGENYAPTAAIIKWLVDYALDQVDWLQIAKAVQGKIVLTKDHSLVINGNKQL